ncbi:MAG: glycoside hydrolase family 3 C-terminal domain-containing protein [Oscillospiraceae bacterium]|jgi:beta-glucosidase|nr:glycoside hydrolase family 3 C-terminal domain-containing protein [Oscillospiraceae bacterium]
MKEKAREIVSKMTLNEKASLCSGADTWRTKPVKRINFPQILMTDGPHGLRKQIGKADNLGVNISSPATCFPPAATTANSFDRELLSEIGAAIAEEALSEKISVVLGPGVNIKRSPLCGRNFEYFSEDPYAAGELGTAIINGIQSKGVGVSLKHFAANNQEQFRMVGNSAIDERALREIYLAAFEKAVKLAKPWTVMCSYNKINGSFASENKRLLTDILRGEWGFDGVVVSDWNAVNDRAAGVSAGLDLEMPASGGFNDKIVAREVKRGNLEEKTLDKSTERLVELVLKSQENLRENYEFDAEAHHKLARKAQAESAVLLKNDDNLLPLKKGAKVAVIGQFAKENPRYQGAGSSRINPLKLDNTYDELIKLGVEAIYYGGENPEEITQLAAKADVVLVFAGLTDDYESEGFDRSTLALPAAHNAMIEAAASANPNTAVILQCGAPVAMPWLTKIRGVLLAYLGGQAGGGGIADILTGAVNPSGKLAETFPLAIEDTPCYGNFSNGDLSVEYRESVFVGYRYYNKIDKPVLFPFGFGLSYTNFEYSDFSADENSASVTVTNCGNLAGAEIIQLYVSAPENSKIYRPAAELKNFEKIFLQPGESRSISFALDRRSFAYYNQAAGKWAVGSGEYVLSAAASSRDIRCSAKVKIAGDGKENLLKNQQNTIFYNLPQSGQLNVPDSDFETIYGGKLPPRRRAANAPLDTNCTLEDVKHKRLGRLMQKIITKKTNDIYGATYDGQTIDEGFRRMTEATQMETPLRAYSMMSEGLMPPARLDGLLLIMNGKIFRGLLKLFRTI